METTEFASLIENILIDNGLPYRIISQSQGERIYCVGVVSSQNIMIMEISVFMSEKINYRIKCFNEELRLPGLSQINLDCVCEKLDISEDIYITIGDEGEISFSIIKENQSDIDDKLFVDDINSVVNACASYTIKLLKLYFGLNRNNSHYIYDSDLCFITDLLNVTFSARYYLEAANATPETASIVDEIISEMNLTDKMAQFRNIDSDKYFICRCYPIDETSQTNYIHGLLKAQIKLDEFAYNNGFEPIRNSVILTSTLLMEISEQTRKDIILNYIKEQPINETLRKNLLDFYSYMCDDQTRALCHFLHYGLCDL